MDSSNTVEYDAKDTKMYTEEFQLLVASILLSTVQVETGDFTAARSSAHTHFLR